MRKLLRNHRHGGGISHSMLLFSILHVDDVSIVSKLLGNVPTSGSVTRGGRVSNFS